ncbi:SpoIVB peptidase [Geochorda subterranea]|uniref:SpoIVB peptidase n=1 Tax=Geochorda subterranea TaxID=3109564 RepID=A0ABZ1BMU1_9FIRM|nr:SpoIVB peptidase [Limnochorda sp. LNt]WRP13447.1 SpoIVB peptidase [Limnochorda sp. LNt]
MAKVPTPRATALRAVVGFCSVALVALLLVTTTFPERLRTFPGRVAWLPVLPMIRVSGPEDRFSVVFRDMRGVGLAFDRPGSVRLELSLWGWLRLRPLLVEVVPPLELMPGGQAIGVMLAPAGVLVEGLLPVQESTGRLSYPARDAGLQVGDVIVEVDGVPVGSPEEVARLLSRAVQEGRPARVAYVRGGRRRETRLMPAAGVVVRGETAARTGGESYGVGLLLRDPAIGVGTLTFYDPRTGRFAALGHMVAEGSRRPVTMPDGRIVRAAISGVAAAARGRPGEKIGMFHRESGQLGIVERNTPVGIFGRLTGELPPGLVTEPLPVALDGQVKEGPATALTVVEGERVEAFAIEVLRIRTLGVPESQRLVLRVTDPGLLARTGGIVQGMSGSPIIQEGHLVGAITHVAVQDPTRGFGVLMEPMVEASGLWGPAEGPRANLSNTRVAA